MLSILVGKDLKDRFATVWHVHCGFCWFDAVRACSQGLGIMVGLDQKDRYAA